MSDFQFKIKWKDNSCHLDSFLSIMILPAAQQFLVGHPENSIYNKFKAVLDESMMGDSLELKTNFWHSNATQIPYGKMFSPSRWAELLPDLFSPKIKFDLKCNLCNNTWIKETFFPGSTLWHCNPFTISEEYDNNDPWPIMPAFMKHQCDKCKQRKTTLS
jgi:hypothetical protein